MRDKIVNIIQELSNTDLKNISNELILKLDKISGCDNLYLKSQERLREFFRIFSKYDFQDMEDGLVEYFDDLIRWHPIVMFSIGKRGSNMGVDWNKINDNNYFNTILVRLISDVFFRISIEKVFNIDDYLKSIKPIFFILLQSKEGGLSYYEKYNLLYVDSVVDNIINKMWRLYKSTIVEREYERYTGNRNIDIYDYTITFELKQR